MVRFQIGKFGFNPKVGEEGGCNLKILSLGCLDLLCGLIILRKTASLNNIPMFTFTNGLDICR